MGRMNVGVLASGRGTDFQSLIDAVERGDLDVHLAVLICNNRDAPVIERAARGRIPWVFVDHRGRSREAFERKVVQELRRREVELVVFAGFMRIVTPHFIEQFPNRIINIHPSLLPAFPGPHAQKDAVAWGVKVSGCTVHLVDASLDGGPIVFQRAVPVRPGDTEESLAARILEVEHRVLPYVVKLFAEGRVRVDGRTVHLDEAGLEPLPPVGT
ncbi:MAG: phosphoribosylglycinamide formyltransferase [Thermoplasmata archaeon]